VNDFLISLMIESQTVRIDDETQKLIRKMNCWPEDGSSTSGGAVEVTQTWEQLNLRGTSPLIPDAILEQDIKITDLKADPKLVEKIHARVIGTSRRGKSPLHDALVEQSKLKPLPLDRQQSELRINPEGPKFIIGTSK
jgi:hypothetical protein